MADRPRSGSGTGGPDQPDFDWLYGTEPKGLGGDHEGRGTRRGRAADVGGPPPDPEPTRMLPTIGRPDDSARRSRSSVGERGPRPGSGPPTRGVTPAPPPTSRGRRRWLRFGWIKLLVLLWVVYLIAVPVWAWTSVHKVPDNPGGGPAAQPGTTYLLVGSDSRKGLSRKQELGYGVGRGSGRRTDTIMLLHTGSGPNLLMSIPRDSLVNVPGHGTDKINSAFAYGGPRLLIKTIQQDTGIKVDDYVEIGFAGFVDVVDAVGGIRICPTQNMDDPLANLHIKKGCQHVGGKVALGYARSRHVSSLGDIARAQHQREVVSAVGHKAVSPWSVLNPLRYFELAKAGSRSLLVGRHTSPIATMKFAWAMTHVNGKNGLTCGVPISDLAVHWDSVRAPQLFKLIAQDKTADIPRSLCSPSGLAQ